MVYPSCRRCGSFDGVLDRTAQTITCQRCGTTARYRPAPEEQTRIAADDNSWHGLLIVALVLLIAYALFDLTAGLRSVRWPTTVGTVIDQQLERSSTRRGNTRYTPTLTIVYQVDGQQRTTQQFRCHSFAPSFRYRREANAFLARYPITSLVPVRYNPQHPADACLIVGTPFWALDLVAVGGLIWWAWCWWQVRQATPRLEPLRSWQTAPPPPTLPSGFFVPFAAIPPALMLTCVSYAPTEPAIYLGFVAGAVLVLVSPLIHRHTQRRFAAGWTLIDSTHPLQPLESTLFFGGLILFFLALLIGNAQAVSFACACASSLLTSYLVGQALLRDKDNDSYT
jgi:hypothetical protein